MKVTYNWLRDFVALTLSPEALADKLTMAGLEVVSLEERLGDYVFEIEVTSNRPDWLSVVGIAREVAAITGKKLKLPQASSLRLQAKNFRPVACGLKSVAIHIQSKKACPLYTAKVIRGVNVGPAPQWMSKRLKLVGCRSVNNIVDITNYCLFTYGEPLHAFDLDKLCDGKGINVRRGRQTETLVTIDGVERNLTTDILVIADSARPVAIAGIMGGKDTEVSAGTKNILLEAAVFDPLLIRRARRKLGLQTDSSYRFERGIDYPTAQNASWLALRLILELAGGEFSAAAEKLKAAPAKKTVDLMLGSLPKTLGMSLPAGKVKNILSALGFKARPKGRAGFKVAVPVFRSDVSQEPDLIEELARISGYEKIPLSLPALRPTVVRDNRQEVLSWVKQTLASLGLQEAKTCGLLGRDALRAWGYAPDNLVEVANPLSKEQEVLRPTLLPGLIECLAYNLNQKEEAVALFEIAKVFFMNDRQPEEELFLGITLCGVRPLMTQEGLLRENLGALHLKGIIETLFERLGLKADDFLARSEVGQFDLAENSQPVGRLFLLPQKLTEALGIKNRPVVAAEIYLEKLLTKANLKRQFHQPGLYPAITRDISIVLKEEFSASRLIGLLRLKAGPFLKDLKIIDYYRGRQIPAGYKGLTVSCIYRSDERTLTEEDVQPVDRLLKQALKDAFGAELR
jgi:phenylalanyl-tRNA synthetase beta chain